MKEELRYLERLAELYPTIGKASTEIINLQSILNLPKGTEHFLSDIHGEYEAFSHVLRNGSGAVRKKIDDVFGHTLSFQVYEIQGSKSASSGLCLRNRRADYRKSGGFG